MMDNLPVYIPNAMVCHMEQYHCCKHRQHCRLYPVCSQIQKPSVCQRNCPTCTYDGCSLTAEQRKNHPVYVAHVIQGDRIDLDLDGQYLREHIAHRKLHKKEYYFFNSLWGNQKEKNRIAYRKRISSDPEYYRIRNREAWRRKHPQPLQVEIPEGAVLPECGLNCVSCPFPDCTLPADWREKEMNRIRNRRYYTRHRERLCKIQKERRQRPEEKARRAAYNKKYQKEHPDQTREKARRYRENHPERVLAIQRAYRQKSKDNKHQKEGQIK